MRGTGARAGARPRPRSGCGARRRAARSRSSSRRTGRRGPGRRAARSDTRRPPRAALRGRSRRRARARARDGPRGSPSRSPRPRPARPRRSPPERPGSWRRIAACSCRSLSPGSMPSSSSVREPGVRAERLGLAARPIEGEHEQLAKPLAERVLAGRATRAPGRGRRHGRARPRSRSAPRPRRHGARRDAGLRSAPTPRRRTRPAAGRARGRARASRSVRRSSADAALASASICSKRRASICSGESVEDVARGPRDEHVRPERLPERRDRVLERGDSGLRRLRAVELVHELLGRYDVTRAEKQRREQRPRPRPAQRDRTVHADHLERAENPKVLHGPLVALPRPSS